MVKFISFEHAFVIAACSIVMFLFSSIPENNIRWFDWVVMYGVILANVRAIKSVR